MQKLSKRGRDLLKTLEGCKLRAYKDIGGVWTIGYGHTGADTFEGVKISAERAEELLLKDLVKFEGGVEYFVKVPLKQPHFDALVLFAYNVGMGALASSTLLKRLNKKDYEGAGKELLRWNKVNGVVVQGLANRRAKEKELWDEAQLC